MSLTRRELTEKRLDVTKRVRNLEFKLDSIEHKLKFHEAEHKLSDYDLILDVELSGSDFTFIRCYEIKDMCGNVLGKIENLSMLDKWLDGYKQGLEDGTIVVELNEEETEKVTKDKKKYKTK